MQIKLENAPVFSINGEEQPPLPGAPAQATEAETAPVLRVRRSPHTQRVEYAELVATAGLALSSLANAEEPLRTLLEENGLTASYIARGVAQRDAALAAVESRQQAIAAEQQTIAAMNEAIERARWAVMALRQVARTVLTDAGAFAALGLDDEMPKSPALFVNEARRTLAAAQREPYAAVLATAAFAGARLTEIEAEIDGVEAALAARRTAQQQAVNATVVRDSEMARLRQRMHQMKVQVNAMLRRNPEMAPPVGF